MAEREKRTPVALAAVEGAGARRIIQGALEHLGRIAAEKARLDAEREGVIVVVLPYLEPLGTVVGPAGDQLVYSAGQERTSLDRDRLRTALVDRGVPPATIADAVAEATKTTRTQPTVSYRVGRPTRKGGNTQ